MTWKGHSYLFINDGNGLRIWSIDAPLAPTYLGGHLFACFNGCITEPAADNDYQLYNFSVCDECRYGVASLGTAGTVIFDLGTGSVPAFSESMTLHSAGNNRGAFTFMYKHHQYMVVNSHPGGCDPDQPTPRATLFLLEGTTAAEATNLQCLVTASGDSFIVDGGIYLRGTAGDFIYLVSKSHDVYIYKLLGSGSDLVLTFQSSPFKSVIYQGSGLRADPSNRYLIAAYSEPTLWDISGANMANPALLADLAPLVDQPVTIAAISYPVVWLGKKASPDAYTFDITDPTAPTPLDQSFWSAEQEWNSIPYLANFDAVFSDDGTALYLARYSVVEQISTGACSSSDGQPVAGITLAPASLFPGDTVTVSDTSTGEVERRAIWINDDFDTTVAGSTVLDQLTDTTLELALPADLYSSQTYTAHVAVESTEFPFNPSDPGVQLATAPVTIDRSPTATISVAPKLPLLGQEVTLRAAAEGSPDSYSWEIKPPGQSQLDLTGVETQITLSERGEWQVGLTASYPHQAVDSGPYQTEAELAIMAASVAASFTISPQTPLPDQALTLDASSSTALPGAQLSFQWLVAGPVTFSSCGDVEQCLIPGGALTPGQYTIRLTVTNQADGDVSTVAREMTLAPYGNSVAVEPSQTTASVGEILFLTITSAPGEIESAVWSFGGPGCDGFTQTLTCIAGGVGCASETYAYSSAGAKQISLSVWVDGVRYDAEPVTISVLGTGECGGGCSYGIHPFTSSFPAAGGAGSVRVAANGVNCQWSATTYASWIEISNGSGGGTGSFNFTVTPNPGPARSRSIFIAGYIHKVEQAASPDFKVDFEISDQSLIVGQPVTLTAADLVTPLSWSLGASSCAGDGPLLSCGAGAECETLTWQFADAGRYDVTLEAREGTVAKTVTVVAAGSCNGGCSAVDSPTPGIWIDPNPAVVGEPVTLTATPDQDPQAAVAEAWTWEIALADSLVTSAAGASFDHTFDEPGSYTVRLITGNCRGAESGAQELEVLPYLQPADLLIPATAHLSGSNDTVWRTDLQVFNPGSETAMVDLELLPDTSSLACTGSARLMVPAMGTKVLTDLLTLIPGLEPEGCKAGVRLVYSGGDGTELLATSRTYNDTPQGTFGQYIPARAVATSAADLLLLTGLASSSRYRTNTGCVNLGDTWAGGITMVVCGPSGEELGASSFNLPPNRLRQIQNVAAFCGVEEELPLFSLRIDTGGHDLFCYASVVDNTTGDPVFYAPYRAMPVSAHLPGVAHIEGLNSSLWRSDAAFYNPSQAASTTLLVFVPETGLAEQIELTLHLEPGESALFQDIIEAMAWPGDSKGYLRVTAGPAATIPVVAARTFNQTAVGTYGQGLALYAGDSYLTAGGTGYIVGIRGSATSDAGFRTNLGILNISETGSARVAVSLLAVDGTPVGAKTYNLSPGQLVQRNLLLDLGLADQELEGSLQLEVVDGGPVAAYASVIDNQTQDPILIPTQLVR
jgi:PKD repeat protein